MKRHLKNYESQVKLFLNKFSVKLKPKETSIWTEKLANTLRNVETFLSEAKFAKTVPLATNVNTKPQVDFLCENIMHEYMAKVDSALFMISSILYLFRSDKAEDISKASDEDVFDKPMNDEAFADISGEVEEKPVIEKLCSQHCCRHV